ncbi:MAG: methyltransferase domain-containing protein [Gallionellaceae bacterium]
MSESLSFDGERFLPECSGEIWYEHWHRYALARQLSIRATVLDVASGEGYGAAMLAENAARVVGVDISPDAVRHARNRYGERANLGFVTASCDNLPFADASFDLAVSFETIEHIETQQEFIAELARVLRADGVLILSSPNKRTYSDAHDYHNEFHVRELYRNELEDLLRGTFPHISWFDQKLLFHSAIWPETSAVVQTEYLSSDGQHVTIAGQPTAEPMYSIAVCCRNPAMIPITFNKISLFSDVAETVYQDYVKQTRRVMQLDSLLKDREQLISERDKYLALRTQQMEERERLIAERDELLALRTEQLNACTGNLDKCSGQLDECDALLATSKQQIAGYEHQVATLNHQLAERASFTWWLKLPLLLIKRAVKANN